jgi:hypothetical protein
MAAMYDDYGNYLGDDGLDERDQEATGGLSPSTYDAGVYTDPTTGEKTDFNSLFNPFGGNTKLGQTLASAQNLLTGKSSLGMAGQLAGLGGIGALLNKMLGGSANGGYAGYQGGIPKYTASRQQYAVPTDLKPMDYAPTNAQLASYVSRPGITDAMVTRTMNQYGVNPERMAGITQLPVDTVKSLYQNAMGPNVASRRPGSGGVTYFSPMQYTPASTATNTATNTTANTAVVTPPTNTAVVPPTGVEDTSYKVFNSGGIANLGSYSDGGQLLRGPGDGVSDSIPANIGGHQPARLADGEFVVPARIVSELGNGSTEAGARKLYAMMDRIKATRAKAKNIAANTKADKHLPA